MCIFFFAPSKDGFSFVHDFHLAHLFAEADDDFSEKWKSLNGKAK